MTLDVNETVRSALEQYGTYMSIEQLGQRWHTAPSTVGQLIKDGRAPGIAVCPEDGLRTKYIIPTTAVVLFEIDLGSRQKEDAS